MPWLTSPGFSFLHRWRTASNLILFTAVIEFIMVFTMQPAFGDTLDIEEDKAFNIRTIGMVLTWSQNILLLLTGISLTILLSVLYYSTLGLRFVTPLLITASGLVVAASSVRLIDNYKEASILKVRKINYAFFLFIPLFVLAGIIEIGLLPFF